jgi:hypothetical protein
VTCRCLGACDGTEANTAGHQRLATPMNVALVAESAHQLHIHLTATCSWAQRRGSLACPSRADTGLALPSRGCVAYVLYPGRFARDRGPGG